MADIAGRSGADTLSGTDGADTIRAAGGDDVVWLSPGDDLLTGGAGFDELRYVQLSGPSVALTIDLELATAQPAGLGSQRLRDFEAMRILTTGNNRLWGGAGADLIVAGMAADYLVGRAGNDTLIATGGADTLYGGAGADFLSVEGAGNWVEAATGNDTVVLTDSGGRNLIDLGEGVSDSLIIRMGGTLDLSGSPSEQGDTITGVEIVQWDGLSEHGELILNGADQPTSYTLSSGAIQLTAGGAADMIQLFALTGAVDAGGGDDQVKSTSGSADLSGGAGDDLIEVLWSAGSDRRIDGGDGHDRLIIDHNHATASLSGGAGDDTILVADGADWVFISGGEGADLIGLTIVQSSRDDLAQSRGGAGQDTLWAVSGGAEKGVRFYGDAGDDHLTGTDFNDVLDGGAGADTLIGGAGDDSYRIDDEDIIVETADGGTGDKIVTTQSYILPEFIEHLSLRGARSSVLRGNDADNRISGRDGNDRLYGHGGADTLRGGRGDDLYRTDALDRVIEYANSGLDTIQSAAGWDLPDNVEVLELLGGAAIDGGGNKLDNSLTGNRADNRLLGRAGDDLIEGGAGNDSLIGGDGADTLRGGAGDDIYYADRYDQMMEMADGGYDRIKIDVDFRLPAEFEELVLSGRAGRGYGNNLDNTLWGNDRANSLFGYEGDDTLSGGAGSDRLNGGAGRDVLKGGAGNDVYFSDGSDLLLERPGEGRDVLYCTRSHHLEDNIENLILDSLDATHGYGNDLSNRINGNKRANLLEGGAGDDRLYGYDGDDRLIGGPGRDRMYGGSGDDRYDADARDSIYEQAGGGLDVVRSTSDRRLPRHVENLILTGDRAKHGYGNDENNRIEGNEINNVLRGDGGSDSLFGFDGNDRLIGGEGRDLMRGGHGNDIYYCDSRDVVTEHPGQGHDIVKIAANFRIPDHVEDVILTGSGDYNVYGNTLDNRITGNRGDNRIEGGGGDDLLYGHGGADRFVFTAGYDRIMDFRDDVDTLYLNRNLVDDARISIRSLLRDYADDGNGHSVLDFGDGDRVFLRGVDNKWDLLDDIRLFG